MHSDSDWFTSCDDPVSARLAVDELVARYVDHCDTHNWSGVVALFEHDGIFDTGDIYNRVLRGPDELRNFYETTVVPLAHHATSCYLTGISSERITARMKMLTLFPGSAFSVDYDWTVTRAQGPWRIAHQKISLVAKVRLGATASPEIPSPITAQR
ncbi:hypothetical protein BayCH28_25905 [Mycolicibacterium sp. CH28]|uniref:nuclear transport factor 2 family protein n=1 Tax=Mycolicibacterium sp. CH28 TaxID=2512237 RepID=UPI0010813504|nr:nuclear transport factor 2 family protein [Mycolicibacterium sp. CH28]TGD84345.1 hypothetical protein BayCH28_25905 [Mycolicibacterium sp. CH28]